MRNRGAIIFLTVTLILACLFEIHFTFVSRKIDFKLQDMAVNDSANYDKYLDSITGNDIWLGYNYNELKQKELNLGLDLKGGMSLTLAISVDEILKALSNDNQEPIFVQAIANAKEAEKNSDKKFLELFREEFEKIDANAKMSTIFATFENKRIKQGMTNDQVLEILAEDVDAAISNAENILRTRIDNFGVVQPNIQRLEDAQGRFVVELPGVKDPERVKSILQTTALLEFRETYENSDDQYRFQSYLMEADTWLSGKLFADELDSLRIADSIAATGDELTPAETEVETVAVEEETVDSSEDDALTADPFLNMDTTENVEDLLGDLPEDEADKTESQLAFEKQHPLLALLQQSNRAGSVVGFARERHKETISEYLDMIIEEGNMIFPPDVKFYWSAKPMKLDNSLSDIYELHAIKNTINGKATLTGEDVTDAYVDYDPMTGQPVVSMSMNAEGAAEWARLTAAAIEGRSLEGNGPRNKCVSVILDNMVQSSPVVNVEIRDGRSQISGGFTPEEATDLSNVLKSGKLPAPARIEQEAIIGPSLGQEAITKGFNSFMIAFLIVILYMLFYYGGRGGLVADIALIVNMFFIIGVLASLKAVLTLPGIAGIVLTIGMSVDANVLIYERIKEEMRAGKGLKLAIADGYKNAYSAILDANITTLLTGIILFIFGIGPIRGFATTLIIGILTSLFSAIFITRLIFTSMLSKDISIKFYTGITKNLFVNTKIDFLGKRKIFYGISAIIVGVGIFSLVTHKLDVGADFTGGRTFVVQFDQEVSTEEVSGLLAKPFGETPEVITFGDNNQVRIETSYKIDDDSKEADAEILQKLYDGLTPLLGADVTIEDFKANYRMSSAKVGPTIADDIKKKAVIAVIFSLLIIFLYILLRFRNWRYGLGALAALVHDVLIVLGVFSLLHGVLPFSLEIDQAFIAAILTVVGYSINDTVVVFDRIREYIGLYPKRNRSEIMNSALNSTMSRTFSTSLSTFVVLATIFVLGSEAIQGFIFALLVGVVVGTYSSLFIATPVVYDTLLKSDKTDAVDTKKK